MKENRTKKILELEGFKKLTPIQQAIVDRKKEERDFIGVSSTGSGKSHAFFIAIFNQIDPELNQVQAVISTPTRELAYQLYERVKKLAKAFDVRVQLCIGGMEKKELALSPQIVIGTPGRLKDLFLDDKILLLNEARLFIIDEADMTLEFGFLEDIDEILAHMSEDVTIMVFSATIPESLQPFLKKYLTNPELVRIDSDEAFQADIEHILVDKKHLDNLEALKTILPTINPYVCLIFANTTKEAAAIARGLRKEGYSLVELHSDLEARERQKAIREISSQKKSYIVASDLASRGIDLEGITHVISLGFPKELQFYHHRAGRTGRAGRDGMAITLVDNKDIHSIQALERQGIEFERKEVKNGALVEVKERTRPHKKQELNAEIAKISRAKNKRKVKPNYKKKYNQKVQNIKRKQKRAFIKEQIREQKKQRAMEKQREKRNSGR